MIAYLDTSVILRITLRQDPQLAEWDELSGGVTSVLTRVECFRSLSRLLVLKRITTEEHLRAAYEIDAILWRIQTLALTRRVLEVASHSWPFALTTLDALHLTTASLYREAQPADEPPITFATHDRELARAAQTLGFRVIGALMQ